MNKVIFLDRDGTINVDYGYVHKLTDLVFMKNAIEGLKLMTKMGYMLIVVTNQSGIGRKMYTIDEYNKFNKYFIDKLLEAGIKITNVYFCPHTEEDNCDCRKPKIGLYKKAIEEYNPDLNKSYVIGDRERDLSICEYTSIEGIIIGSKNDKYIFANDLLDAAKYIQQCSKE
ncbi:MAG: D-glycero-alpha-D-manno-heptose-1,7-bisphosphate 7-phosphatase [Ignavibacteriales bacterium]